MPDEEDLADLATALLMIVGEHIDTKKCAHCQQLFNEARKRAFGESK
jgi:hypothetical protein